MNAKCQACGEEIKNTSRQEGVKYLCSRCLVTGMWRRALEQKAEMPPSPSTPEPVQSLLVEAVARPSEPAKPLFCLECGGPKRGRGWTHSGACSHFINRKDDSEKKTCPLCGGVAKGSGFIHKPGCQLVELAKKLAN